MRIDFINVGYGDSILVEYDYSGGRYNILIDGGRSDGENYNGFLQRIKTIDYLKGKGINKLDLLVITHLHEDHVGGLLEVVKNIEIEEVWSNYVFHEVLIGRKLNNIEGLDDGTASVLQALNTYNEICDVLKARGKAVKEIRGLNYNKNIVDLLYADIFGPIGDDAESQAKCIETIYSENSSIEIGEALNRLNSFINNTSLVLRFIYGDKKILLAGDVYHNYWERFKDKHDIMRAHILKLPHHGHLDSVSKEFIESVRPEFVIVSTSNSRTDNCPNPEVIKMFNQYNKFPFEPDNNLSCENGYSPSGKTQFLFTDAVDMPGYSTKEMEHRAIVFNLYIEKGIEHEYI